MNFAGTCISPWHRSIQDLSQSGPWPNFLPIFWKAYSGLTFSVFFSSLKLLRHAPALGSLSWLFLFPHMAKSFICLLYSGICSTVHLPEMTSLSQSAPGHNSTQHWASWHAAVGETAHHGELCGTPGTRCWEMPVLGLKFGLSNLEELSVKPGFALRLSKSRGNSIIGYHNHFILRGMKWG